MWSYSRELREDEPLTHAKTIDLFKLEQKWEKQIFLTGWFGSRVVLSSWPEHLEDYSLSGEEGKRNSRPDDLLGWEHIEYAKVVIIKKGN
jgi:hypothetical protein